MLVLLFVALWFILRGDLFYVLPCVILFLCFSVLLALGLPRLRKKGLILALFVRLFNLCLFGFVCFLFLLVSGKDCGLWLWHCLDFSLTFFDNGDRLFKWFILREEETKLLRITLQMQSQFIELGLIDWTHLSNIHWRTLTEHITITILFFLQFPPREITSLFYCMSVFF